MFAFSGSAAAQTSTQAAKKIATGSGQAEPAKGGDGKALSDAERIARLQRAIDESERLLLTIKSSLENPNGEYAIAEASFTKLDGEYRSKKKELAAAESQAPGAVPAQFRTDLNELEKRWKLAKDRFDLAIQDRKSSQEAIIGLEQSLQHDRAALQKLLSPAATSQPAPTTPQMGPPAAEPTPQKATSQPASVTPTPPTMKSAPEAGPSPSVSPIGLANPLISLKGSAESSPPPLLVEKRPSKEQIEAGEQAKAKEAVAQQAKMEEQTISDRLTSLRKAVDLGRKMLETTRKQAQNAKQTVESLEESINQKRRAGASQAELDDLWNKVASAKRRQAEAQKAADERSEMLSDAQDDLSALQAEQLAASQQAQARLEEAEAARKRYEDISDPFHPRNVWRWLTDHGVKSLGILLGCFVLLWLMRVSRRRLVALLARSSHRGDQEERENRAATLVAVFRSAATVAIVVGGLLMILTEVGVNVVPLLGGAAVIGLAVAFGAQNLIKDYFSGFMILLENQYGINDVIEIGSVSGQVERVTLRITVLRDLAGTVHFIPNGQINLVSNKTHEWSRAVFEVGVAYKENVDEVMRILVDLGKELRRDPEFRDFILDDPEMLGVDALGESTVVIKFILKTRPTKRWQVRREMLRRIKNRFDQLGIEIPFPHRTIFVRHGDAPADRDSFREDLETPARMKTVR